MSTLNIGKVQDLFLPNILLLDLSLIYVSTRTFLMLVYLWFILSCLEESHPEDGDLEFTTQKQKSVFEL